MGYDIAAVCERTRLLLLRLHCAGCEVEWHGGGPCWSCGAAGRPGALPELEGVR